MPVPGQVNAANLSLQDHKSEVSQELFPLKVHIHKDIWEDEGQVQGVPARFVSWGRRNRGLR